MKSHLVPLTHLNICLRWHNRSTATMCKVTNCNQHVT